MSEDDTEDDDWFERALGDDEDDADDTPSDDVDDPLEDEEALASGDDDGEEPLEPDETDQSGSVDDSDSEEGFDGDSFAAEFDDAPAEERVEESPGDVFDGESFAEEFEDPVADDGAEESPSDGFDDESSAAEVEDTVADDGAEETPSEVFDDESFAAAFGDADGGEGTPRETFDDESFAAAFEEAASRRGDTGGREREAFEGAGDAGDASGGTDDPFDDGGFGEAMGDQGGEGDLFDEDFASAFGGPGDDEFADEEFESEIPRIDLGISGLDDMIQGGVPERSLMVAIGSAGTGKTTFGLQFLYHGLTSGQKGVFITLEQSRDEILDTANEWGWDFEAYESDGDLAIVDLDPVEMANSLDNIRGELPALIEAFGADRLVLDSVSLLEMMYDEQSNRRTEVFDFSRSLKDAGVTTFLTSEASESNPYASRFGIIEYLTDAVFILQYVRSESSETRLAIEIQKIRNANHSREKKPYELTDEGISVYQQANIF